MRHRNSRELTQITKLIANMGPTWVLSAPGGPHVARMNLAIRGVMTSSLHRMFSQISSPPRHDLPSTPHDIFTTGLSLIHLTRCCKQHRALIIIWYRWWVKPTTAKTIFRLPTVKCPPSDMCNAITLNGNRESSWYQFGRIWWYCRFSKRHLPVPSVTRTLASWHYWLSVSWCDWHAHCRRHALGHEPILFTNA